MTVSRREMLRLGAIGVGGAMLSSAANPVGLPATVFQAPRMPLVPPAPQPSINSPIGISAQLFQRAKAALDSHRVYHRDVIGIVDFSLASREERFHVVDLRNASVESYRVTHGRGSDPAHSGFLDRFSNDFGSLASSNGTYVTADTYHGKYGLSMKVRGLDWTNNNAEARAIVIHNAWYAEPEAVRAHGKLGRSEGCFAFSRADQWKVMQRLGGGRMIYADKIA